MAKKHKKHHKLNLTKKILIIGGSVLGAGVVTTAIVVPVVLTRPAKNNLKISRADGGVIITNYDVTNWDFAEIQETYTQELTVNAKDNEVVQWQIEYGEGIDETNVALIPSNLGKNTKLTIASIPKVSGNYTFNVFATIADTGKSAKKEFNIKFLNCVPKSMLVITGDDVTGRSDDWPWGGIRGYDTLYFPEGIKSIKDEVFSEQLVLGDDLYLLLPESLISIGAQAFYRDTNIRGTLVLPKNLTDIGKLSFSSCSISSSTGGFDSIVIQNPNLKIHEGAFNSNSHLKYIESNLDPNPTIEVNAFRGCATSGTVRSINYKYSSSDLLAYLKTYGLNDSWTVAE